MVDYPRRKTETDLKNLLSDLKMIEKPNKKIPIEINNPFSLVESNRLSLNSFSSQNNNFDSLFQTSSETKTQMHEEENNIQLFNNSCRFDTTDRLKLNDYLLKLYKDTKMGENIDEVGLEEIINEQLTVNNKISFFRTLDLFNEKHIEIRDSLKQNIVNLQAHLYNNGASMKSTNRISQFETNNFNHISLKLYEIDLNSKENKEVPNISHYTIDEKGSLNPFAVSQSLINLLRKTNVSKETSLAFNNVFIIDLRSLAITNNSVEEDLLLEVLKINNLFSILIINQYDFENLYCDGKTISLGDKLKQQMFHTIQKNSDLNEIFLG